MQNRLLKPIGAPAPAAATARRLVIVIPGMGSNVSRWASLVKELQNEAGYGPAEAEWMSFEHGIKPWTIGALRPLFLKNPGHPSNLEILARQLRNLIDEQWRKHGGYDDVVLIGHSMGGLLARRIYLLASGAVPGQQSFPWGARVSRIVLFAAVNRGFSLASLPPLQKLASWLARAFYRRVFYFEDVLQGSDFVTNLRIDWIRHFRAIEDQAPERMKHSDTELTRVPLVIQFLGDRDELMNPEDNMDVLAFPNGHYQPVAGANHANLFQLDGAPDPAGRYAVLREGFFGELETMTTDPRRRPKKSPIKRVVMIQHGIRADNVDEWITGLASKIKQRDPELIWVSTPTYGYFSALRFTIPLIRRRNIPTFRDEYTELLAEYPRAEFNIIAHSNGTYMLGHSLEKTPGMRFQNVVLAGSALPEDYQWAKLKEPDIQNNRQVGRVLNERANRDVPIAILCNMLYGLGMKDVGRAGFAGFRGDSTMEVAYHQGGHGKALETDNQDRLVDFIFGREPAPAGNLIAEPGYLRQLSEASRYLGWVVIFGIPILVYVLSLSNGVLSPVRLLWIVVVLIAIVWFLDSV